MINKENVRFDLFSPNFYNISKDLDKNFIRYPTVCSKKEKSNTAHLFTYRNSSTAFNKRMKKKKMYE